MSASSFPKVFSVSPPDCDETPKALELEPADAVSKILQSADGRSVLKLKCGSADVTSEKLQQLLHPAVVPLEKVAPQKGEKNKQGTEKAVTLRGDL